MPTKLFMSGISFKKTNEVTTTKTGVKAINGRVNDKGKGVGQSHQG
ncbi:MAG: hypothetical protein QF907_06220 [Nitrospinota bacterium]|jgi:hypothetical protein|nr:hypothetical protein [Nitrospinota bacterium]MDP7580017.1 hypothetical protein [Nitrospinota bacterium]